MKTNEFFRWDIDVIDSSFQDQLDDGNELGSIFSEALENISPKKRVQEIISPVTEKLREVFTVEQPLDDQSTTEIEKLKRQQLISRIQNRLGSRFDSQLKDIDNYLYQSDAQTAATNQHNQKMHKRDFQRETLIRLKEVAQLLPANHPIRLRIESL